MCDKNTAKRAKRRIHMFMIMRNPLNSLPSILNSDQMTVAQVGLLLHWYPDWYNGSPCRWRNCCRQTLQNSLPALQEWSQPSEVKTAGRWVNHTSTLVFFMFLLVFLYICLCITSVSPVTLQVTAGIDDSTYLVKSSTEDPHFRGDLQSGKRGHGDCLLVGHQVDLKGKFIALRPPSIACTPRGSDTTIMALQVSCLYLLY